jgi:hypothetical protein
MVFREQLQQHVGTIKQICWERMASATMSCILPELFFVLRSKSPIPLEFPLFLTFFQDCCQDLPTLDRHNKWKGRIDVQKAALRDSWLIIAPERYRFVTGEQRDETSWTCGCLEQR